eukprot:GGOE01006247.1.p2 GENE.GGOE01006247.1~~GGOE01006247.1.p2  ORF type:complete len:132 (-),score=4.93 GGOE01006247.1:388-783(-)
MGADEATSTAGNSPSFANCLYGSTVYRPRFCLRRRVRSASGTTKHLCTMSALETAKRFRIEGGSSWVCEGRAPVAVHPVLLLPSLRPPRRREVFLQPLRAPAMLCRDLGSCCAREERPIPKDIPNAEVVVC